MPPGRHPALSRPEVAHSTRGMHWAPEGGEGSGRRAPEQHCGNPHAAGGGSQTKEAPGQHGWPARAGCSARTASSGGQGASRRRCEGRPIATVSDAHRPGGVRACQLPISGLTCSSQVMDERGKVPLASARRGERGGFPRGCVAQFAGQVRHDATPLQALTNGLHQNGRLPGAVVLPLSVSGPPLSSRWLSRALRWAHASLKIKRRMRGHAARALYLRVPSMPCTHDHALQRKTGVRIG